MFKGVDNRICSEVESLSPRLKTKSRIWFEKIKNPRPSWVRFRDLQSVAWEKRVALDLAARFAPLTSC